MKAKQTLMGTPVPTGCRSDIFPCSTMLPCFFYLMFSLLPSNVTLLHFLQDFSVEEVNGFFHVGPYMEHAWADPRSPLLTYLFYKVSCFMTGHSPSCVLL